MDASRIRNLGVVAHIDAGKTTLTERILFYAGAVHRMGEVHEGTAVMDWMDEERRRGITITAAATHMDWRGHDLSLIDTPGHVDFTVEVERCMRVLDGAVLLLNAVSGVQAQSETVWRQIRRHSVPYVVFVNQCDRPGADYFRSIDHLIARLEVPAIALQYPVGKERDLRVIVDLVEGRAWHYPAEELGRDPREVPIPDDALEEVGVLRAELLDRLAEQDEVVLQAVVEEREPPVEAVRAALRKRVLEQSLVPVLLGAALRNVGVQQLLDAVVDLLPSPLDAPPVRGTEPSTGEPEERPPLADAPVCALAFKLATDAHDDLTYVRVYSGRLHVGEKLYNPRVGRMERVARLLRMHAEAREPLEEAGPGSIVALTGLRFTGTGDTLCDRDAPIALEPLAFPEPVLTLVVEPRSSADRDRLRAALERLDREDPTFHVREDGDTGQWLIAGMGELHLEVLVNRLRSESHLDVTVGQPRVAYREAVAARGTGHGVVDRLLGGKPVHGDVELEIVPDADAGSPRLEWAADCGVPLEVRASVESSLVGGAPTGPRFGFPLVQAAVRVTGGASVPGKDSELGFAQAASNALREALAAARIELLEPVMDFEIRAPAEFMSGILAELNACRADIGDLLVDGGDRTVVGRVPLATMFGYSTTLRSLSQGRADFTLTPAGFAAVPEGELAARGLVWD